jgi:hypothetical protein
MTDLKTVANQLVPLGFTIRVTEPGTIAMKTEEMLPYKDAIKAFIATEREYHDMHRIQAESVLEIAHHEDASMAAGMAQMATGFVEELDHLAAAFNAPHETPEFEARDVIIEKMFNAINADAAVPA